MPFSKQKILNNTIATVADRTKSVVETTIKTTNNKGGKCWIHPDTTSHALPQCQSFLAMTVDEQWKFVKEHRLCFACFGTYHISKDRNATLKCEKCCYITITILHYTILTYSYITFCCTDQKRIIPTVFHQNQGHLKIDLVM